MACCPTYYTIIGHRVTAESMYAVEKELIFEWSYIGCMRWWNHTSQSPIIVAILSDQAKYENDSPEKDHDDDYGESND